MSVSFPVYRDGDARYTFAPASPGERPAAYVVAPDGAVLRPYCDGCPTYLVLAHPIRADREIERTATWAVILAQHKAYGLRLAYDRSGHDAREEAAAGLPAHPDDRGDALRPEGRPRRGPADPHPVPPDQAGGGPLPRQRPRRRLPDV